MNVISYGKVFADASKLMIMRWGDYLGLYEEFPAAAAAKSLQSCPTLCDPIDGSPPSSPVPGILQARVLEWGSIAFSDGFPYFLQFKSEFGNKEFMI